jgi:hypothetical protein
MRNIIIVAIALLLLAFASCTVKSTVPAGIGIPQHVSHVEFWNGGGKIASYDNATVITRIDTSEKVLGAGVYFYRYEVTVKGETDVIVDSEALAILYRE